MAHQHDGLAAAAQLGHGLHHGGFVQGIECARGLVEQDERRVAQKDTSETDALALSARERVAQLGDRCVESLRQAFDERGECGGATGRFELFLAGIGARDEQVLAQRAHEQVGVLRHVGLLCAQALRIDAAHVGARDAHAARGGVPKAHKELEQRGLARARAARDAGHGAHGEGAAYVIEDECTGRLARVRPRTAGAVGKGDMLRLSPRKGNVHAVCDVGALRFLIEQIEHALARGQGGLQGCAQTAHGYDGAKGGEKRESRHKGGRGLDGPAGGKAQRAAEHAQARYEHERIGGGLAGGLAALQACVNVSQLAGHAAQALSALGRAFVLDRLGDAAQAVEHKRAQTTRLLAARPPGAAARLGGDVGQADAQHGVGGKCRQRELAGDARQERLHHDGADDRDGDGRDGVRVEDLKQLDIACDEAHQVALAAPLELGRGQAAQGGKDQCAHVRQQAEGDVVVTELLAVVERSARDAADGAERTGRDERHTECVGTRAAHEGECAKGGHEGRREHADAAECHGEQQPTCKRRDELHHAGHDGKGPALRACCDGRGLLRCSGGATGGRARYRLVLGWRLVLGGLLDRKRRERLLAFPHARVDAVRLEQLAMRALLGQLPTLHHQDGVCLGDGSEPVRDHQHRVVARERGDDLADGGFARGVDVARGLVKHVDGRVVQKRPRHADALALPAGEVGAGLGDAHVESAVRAHEGRDARALERGHEVGIACVGACEQQILAQGAGKEMAVGGHECHGLHERVRRGVAQLGAAYAHTARIGPLASAQDARERRLAAAGLTHERNQLTGLDTCAHLL